MDKDELWNLTLSKILEGATPDKSYFLPQLTPLGVFGGQFILLTDSEQVGNWVKSAYAEEIARVAQEITGMSYTVQVVTNPASNQQVQPIQQSAQQETATPQNSGSVFSVPNIDFQTANESVQTEVPDFMNTFVSVDDLPGQQKHQAQPVQQEQTQQQNQSRYQQHQQQRPSRSGNEALFSKCTFETFVVGKSNEFARGAALAVAEQPGTVYNPLFIYGNSGLGKTHLLVSIDNYISQNYPNMRTCYVSASEFLNDYVEATQRNSWGSFNAKYHNADVLLVDDVQYLEGKDETINQLFMIFNEMTSAHKQVVLSADRAPKDIDMDTRVTSRFVSGLLADVKTPDYETRLAIIKNCYLRASQVTTFNGVIGDEVLNWLAENAGPNIREMEGAVTRLIGNMNLTRKPNITVDEAQEILQDIFRDPGNTQVSISAIQAEVERYFNVSHEDMVSKKRNKSIAYPRQIAIYLCRFLTSESLESIGKKFGGRDHTTIMHSVSNIEKGQKDNGVLYNEIGELTERLKARP